MFKSILCPVDFSPHSESALLYARELARLTGAHLTIVTVVDALLDAAAGAAGTRDSLTAQTQQELHAMLERIEPPRGTSAERPGIAVVVGDPAATILEQADDCEADLIVMGTQGLSGATRLVFGSTTEQVLREARVPILAVPLLGSGK